MSEKNICVVRGVEGPSVYLFDHRIAGNKPWGGGQTILELDTDVERVLTAIATSQKEDLRVYNFWRNGNYRVTIERLKEEPKP